MRPSAAARLTLRTLALGYLGCLVLAPVLLILVRTFAGGVRPFVESVTTPAAIAALDLSLLVVAITVPVNVVFGPLVEAFYPMPKSALIPVTVIWLGFGDGSKILLIFLGCMLPVVIGAYNGARSTEQVMVWSARSMGAGRLRMMWDVVIPSALPEIMNGIRTALALAFILMVTSELIVAREGLGNLIGFLGANGSYAAMYAVVLTVAFMGFAADRIYQLAARRVLAWREAALS